MRSAASPLLKLAALGLAVTAAPADARQYKIIRSLPPALLDRVTVASTQVTLGADALAAMVSHDAKAAAKPADPNDPSTLPFTRMFPIVAADVFRRWELAGARAVTLHVTVYHFKVANVGRAVTTGTRDAMSGLVEVVDPVNNISLALFTVRVVNRHAGWTGMLLRGGGVREKLAAELALEAARVLSGRQSPPNTSPPKARR